MDGQVGGWVGGGGGLLSLSLPPPSPPPPTPPSPPLSLHLSIYPLISHSPSLGPSPSVPSFPSVHSPCPLPLPSPPPNLLSLLCQVGGCCHILCPTWPLVLAFGAAGQESAWLFGQHSLWQTPGPACRRPTQGRALQQLGRPVTAMGRPVVCTASALLLETIGNGGGI